MFAQCLFAPTFPPRCKRNAPCFLHSFFHALFSYRPSFSAPFWFRCRAELTQSVEQRAKTATYLWFHTVDYLREFFSIYYPSLKHSFFYNSSVEMPNDESSSIIHSGQFMTSNPHNELHVISYYIYFERIRFSGRRRRRYRGRCWKRNTPSCWEHNRPTRSGKQSKTCSIRLC